MNIFLQKVIFLFKDSNPGGAESSGASSVESDEMGVLISWTKLLLSILCRVHCVTQKEI